jgi:hypothetical protein
MYAAEALKVWNGAPFNGQQEIVNLSSQLPVSQHKVECIDAHHVRFPKNYTGLVITVTGTLKLGLRPEKKFHQTFVIQQDLTKPPEACFYHIVSDLFRSAEY